MLSGREAVFEKPLWLVAAGLDQDVVVATRARIARNVAGFPFPWRASQPEREEVARDVRRVVESRTDLFGRGRHAWMTDVDPETALSLVAWRYVSKEWIAGPPGAWFFAGSDNGAALMVNEEDHVRAQVVLPGLQVSEARAFLGEIESALAERIEMAWRDDVGYLTASPANAGTGIRLSVMLHLPGLAAAQSLDDAIEAARFVGCSVRGANGEGPLDGGDLIQLSNSATQSDLLESTVRKLGGAAAFLISSEREARSNAFGTQSGVAELQHKCRNLLNALFGGGVQDSDLPGLVSTLRLAVSMGHYKCGLECCSEWLTMTGTVGASAGITGQVLERYLAVTRPANLRTSIRSALGWAEL